LPHNPLVRNLQKQTGTIQQKEELSEKKLALENYFDMNNNGLKSLLGIIILLNSSLL
jgi:hypothetical protein